MKLVFSAFSFVIEIVSQFSSIISRNMESINSVKRYNEVTCSHDIVIIGSITPIEEISVFVTTQKECWTLPLYPFIPVITWRFVPVRFLKKTVSNLNPNSVIYLSARIIQGHFCLNSSVSSVFWFSLTTTNNSTHEYFTS